MVILSHPTGNENSRQALLTLVERQMLAAFYTTISWDGSSVWNKLLPLRVSKELNRRGYPGISKRMIHTAPIREICRLLSVRLGLISLFEKTHSLFSISRIYKHMDTLVAEAIASRPPQAVYAYEGGALQSFRTARRMGVKTIYELPIAYWHHMNDILREEAELQPAFADTLPRLFVDPDWLRRKDEELELTDQLIVPSRYVQSTLPQTVSAKVWVIPYGAPPVLPDELLPRSRKTSKLRVLYVGSLTQRKGISYLLEALQKVESAVEFTIIGTRVGSCKPLDAALQRYRWLPTLPHNMVLEEMSRHDVLVCPTLSEGFALVILEAMSRGLTVITTPSSGGLEVINDGKDGFIVPIRSSEAIVEKLELLAGDRELLEAMSEAAQQRAQECTWHRYRELLASNLVKVLA